MQPAVWKLSQNMGIESTKASQVKTPVKRRVPAEPLDPALVPWLLATALVTLAPHAAHTGYWQIALVGAVLIWRGWLWYRGSELPNRWPLVGITLLGCGGVVFEFRRFFGQDPGVALLLLFMALKLMEARGKRDAVVVVMLAYFLLLTHYFYQDGIPTGAWMLVALTVVTATLMRLQTAALDTTALLKKSAFMIAQSLPVMALLFLLFPRIDGPLWGLPQDDRRATTGLTDQMSPGSISNLIQNPAIAFRVEFAGDTPAYDQLYWRGPVMIDFDGRTWRIQRGALPMPTANPIKSLGTEVAYTLTLEPHQQRWLPALDMPTSLPRDTFLTPTLSVLRKRAVQERFRFESRSVTSFQAGINESREMLARNRVVPARANPRSRALATRWYAEAGDPEAYIQKILRHFRDEKFIYTLQPPLLGEHSVDDFLLGTRRGFCEHYASSFAFMMRAVGIPARVIGGYQGGERNPVDGYWVVRQSDAHAWVEVWLTGKGWVRVDPTAAIAPSRIEQGIAAAAPQSEDLPAIVRGGMDWLRKARYQWEAVNNAWNQWVLGYDTVRQIDLLGRLGLKASWQSLVGTLAIAAGAAVIVFGLWALRRDRPSDPVQRLWLQFSARMARRGLAREPWEGPRDFIDRLTVVYPEKAGLLSRIGRLYSGLRYGSAKTDDLETLRRQLRSFNKT